VPGYAKVVTMLLDVERVRRTLNESGVPMPAVAYRSDDPRRTGLSGGASTAPLTTTRLLDVRRTLNVSGVPLPAEASGSVSWTDASRRKAAGEIGPSTRNSNEELASIACES
jgi:hypothetical protein